MTHPARRNLLQRTAELTIAALFGFFALLQNSALAQGDLPPRLQIGINLLPAVIAANTGIANLPAEQPLKLHIVYLENAHDAELLHRAIGRVGMIRKRTLETAILSLDELLAKEVDPLTTLFIAEPLDERLGELVEYSRARRALLFSPFEGDVPRGVATGFQVTDRVRPLVNMESLRLSKIQLKAFFLRIAVKHE